MGWWRVSMPPISPTPASTAERMGIATASPVACRSAGGFFLRQGRRSRRLMRLRGIGVMTVAPLSESPLLAMKNITKEYRGVAALKAIDFDLRRGEVHALLGENGAGKSTLVKILSGAVAPTQGDLSLEGQRIQIAGPADARRYGIAMVYQETSLVPSLSVAQNLYLGDEKFFNRLRGTYIEAQQLFQSLNFPVDPTAIVQSLGTAKRQMVEIARAVRLQGENHHIRRADRHSDAGGEALPLRPYRSAAKGTGFDHLHQPRAGGSARNLRSHHHSQGRRSRHNRRRQDVFPRDDRPPHGWPNAEQ